LDIGVENAGSGPRDGQFSQGTQNPGLAEALVVWTLLALTALAILVTYSRMPPRELYNVTGDGLTGGLSRVLVFLNYPIALMAIAVLALVTDRLGARRLGLLALGLCLVVVVPGVVDQGDLDAKWSNTLPALGVALVLAMTIWGIRSGGIGGWGSARGDRARIVAAVVLVFLGLPWIFAEVGLYVSDVPGSIFRAEEPYQGHASVHLGEHHGFHGLLLVLTALLLSRELGRMRPTRLRTGLTLYLALMIPYGLGNYANDAWLEQVVKRGWTSWQIPDMIRPEPSWMWAITIAAGAALFLALRRLYEPRSTLGRRRAARV
jgi:hypothetical protein